MRRLEIGPGSERVPGFETLNAVATPSTDHLGDARNPPFPDATFAEVYSAHCIEHVEQYEVEPTIAEWVRILRPGGFLEVHTVNAAPLMQAMLEWEETGETGLKVPPWREELHGGDAFTYAAIRLLNYPKKHAERLHMHRALLTPRYLRRCFERAGLVDIEDAGEPKGGKKHRSINMGLRGRKHG